MAVLRRFIPQLAQELADGKVRKPRAENEPRKKDKRKGKKAHSTSEAADSATEEAGINTREVATAALGQAKQVGRLFRDSSSSASLGNLTTTSAALGMCAGHHSQTTESRLSMSTYVAF